MRSIAVKTTRFGGRGMGRAVQIETNWQDAIGK